MHIKCYVFGNILFRHQRWYRPQKQFYWENPSRGTSVTSISISTCVLRARLPGVGKGRSKTKYFLWIFLVEQQIGISQYFSCWVAFFAMFRAFKSLAAQLHRTVVVQGMAMPRPPHIVVYVVLLELLSDLIRFVKRAVKSTDGNFPWMKWLPASSREVHSSVFHRCWAPLTVLSPTSAKRRCWRSRIRIRRTKSRRRSSGGHCWELDFAKSPGVVYSDFLDFIVLDTAIEFSTQSLRPGGNALDA